MEAHNTSKDRIYKLRVKTPHCKYCGLEIKRGMKVSIRLLEGREEVFHESCYVKSDLEF
jgi:hypothetical protein